MTKRLPPSQTVVLIHGMGRTGGSLLVLEHRLKDAGYATLNFPYSQTDGDLDGISDAFAAFLTKSVKTSRYHIVGHSLGNIVVRNALKKPLRPGLARLVMKAFAVVHHTHTFLMNSKDTFTLIRAFLARGGFGP